MQIKHVCLIALSVFACGVFVSAAEVAKVPAAENIVKFSGDAEYRFRYDYTKNYVANGDNSSNTGNYSNRYSWNLKLKITVNENLGFGVRLSNPMGSNTEAISDNIGTVADETYKRPVAIPEMSFNWTTGGFYLGAGILAVQENMALNMAAYENKSFKVGEQQLATWNVLTNASLIGANLGYKISNTKDFALTLDGIVATGTDGAAGKPSEVFKADKMRFVLSAPIALMGKKITFVPAGEITSNTYRSTDLKNGNNAYVGGLDIGVTPVEMLTVKAGYSVGGTSNSNLNPVASAAIAPIGHLIAGAFVLKPGFGIAMFDYMLGLSTDREAVVEKAYTINYFDIKYVMPVKKLSIIPRVRIWALGNDIDDAGKTVIRPEIILKAAF